jgi:2-polyprenyl-3-methyl-5-hydroxy-6-metoxy-1,4-benzoquinol methylase
MNQQQQKNPSPEQIFDLLFAYQRSATLKGAIDLEFFTAVAEGNTTVGAIAKRCRASERGIRILADNLTVLGLVTKDGSNYSLTTDTALFLDKRSPAYIGSAANFLMDREITKGFDDIAGAVRAGGTVIPNSGTISTENPVWVEFAKSMGTMMMPNAQAIPEIAGAGGAPKWKVLDIAAGHGMFGIMMAAKNPNAEIVALDWPMVLQVAEDNAKKFGIADRWKKLPGDALTLDYGTGYDIVLLTNFLHHFDPATNEKLMKKVHSALKPDGRALTLEFVPNEDRVSPPVPATFSMVMLATTPSGDAYTFPEFDRMFKNAGFKKSDVHDLPGLPERLIVSHA